MPIAVGNKAQGPDFYDRYREREEMWSLLRTTNVQFSGARRLGKSLAGGRCSSGGQPR